MSTNYTKPIVVIRHFSCDAQTEVAITGIIYAHACSITTDACGGYESGGRWAGVPTCRNKTHIPIGCGVTYVYRSTRVFCAIVYGYYACTVAHVWSVR